MGPRSADRVRVRGSQTGIVLALPGRGALSIVDDRMRRVAIVCGGRDIQPKPHELAELHRVLEEADIEVVRTGGATGVDAAVHAHVRDVWDRHVMPADWNSHGKAAGPRRNQTMLDAGGVVLLVAWPGGAGTADMIARAERARIRVHRIGVGCDVQRTMF